MEKNNSTGKVFFKFDIYSFFTGTVTTNKLDDGIPVAHF